MASTRHTRRCARMRAAQGAAIGDVFVSSGKMHHDRRIPLPGFDKFGIGYVATLPTPNMQRELGLKPGAMRAVWAAVAVRPCAHASERLRGLGGAECLPPNTRVRAFVPVAARMISRLSSLQHDRARHHRSLAGIVTSGDSLDYTAQCMEIMTKHGAAVRGRALEEAPVQCCSAAGRSSPSVRCCNPQHTPALSPLQGSTLTEPCHRPLPPPAPR